MSRLFSALLVCAVLTSVSVGQTSHPAKPDTSEEALVFDRLDNLVRFEDDGTGGQRNDGSHSGAKSSRCSGIGTIGLRIFICN